MRHIQAVINIILAFLLMPLAADYFEAQGICWGIGVCIIVHETWLVLFKKTVKDMAEEKARLVEARQRVEQIKQEAAMVYLQPAGGKKGAKSSTSMDVDRMSPSELANAARQIVQDIRVKKDPKGEEAPPAAIPKAA